MIFNNNRREFLKKTFAASAATIPLMGLFGTKLEAAEVSDEYKAIVCVMLHGGADSFNMVIPTSDNEYADYLDVRSSIAVDQQQILEFNHRNENNLNNSSYGFRPEMSAMKALFDSNQLGIVANVGTLIQPITPSDVSNKNLLPNQLFAHNTQQNEWAFVNCVETQTKGVFARVADTFYSSGNPYFNIGINNTYLAQKGSISSPLRFDSANISDKTMDTYGFSPLSGGAEVGNVYLNMHKNSKISNESKINKSLSDKVITDLNTQSELQGLFDEDLDFNYFDEGKLSSSLEIVAKILSVRNNFPGRRKRQIFVVQYGGWDTHAIDNNFLCQELSDSLGDFQASLSQMGIEDSVTTFTISEFGRKVQSNEKGTDHGWGAHHFVIGGAVRGGDVFGKMPSIKRNSPDAWSNRVIPTMSVEEYMSPIIKWFGATDSEVNSIFGNLKSFPQNLNNFMV